ncbi:MAG: Ig-like domain-containing protein [Gammaproteobacteria bacterium]|nr:Ig-like domain-containing protein [Gammaproteobacteria bacterium]
MRINKKICRVFCVALVVSIVSACGGGGSGGDIAAPVNEAPVPPVISNVTVSGMVSKGPLDSADVDFIPIDAFGAVAGDPIASTTTAADGSFTATIPQGSGALLIRTSGGAYVDEADPEPDPALRRRIVLGPGEGLESLLPPGTTSVTVSIATQALLDKTRRETLGGTFLQQFAANRELASGAFGFDILTTMPTDTISPDQASALEQREYAMVLGGLANLVNRVSLNAGLLAPNIETILAVATDFSDGRIDGMVDGAPVLVGGSPIVVLSLNEEIARFRNNNFPAYSSTAVVTVNEDVFSQIGVPINNLPLAVADLFSLSVGGTLSVAAPGVLGNDSDADGNPLTAELVGSGPASAASFNLSSDGSFTYIHDGSGIGTDSFMYNASDGPGDSNVVTVTLDINNRPPVVNDDVATVAEGGTIVSASVLLNDVDDEVLTAMVVDLPVNGQLTFNSDGTYEYTHNGSETSTDRFSYVANDGIVNSNTAEVVITVTPVNDPPVAINDSATVERGSTFSILSTGASSVLANDNDAENDSLTARLIDLPAHGQVVLRADGTIDYVHNGDLAISDSFGYVANDGSDDSAVATVNITVTNAMPRLTGDCVVVTEGGTATAVNDPNCVGRAANVALQTLAGTAPGSTPMFFGTTGSLVVSNSPLSVAPDQLQSDDSVFLIPELLAQSLPIPVVLDTTGSGNFGTTGVPASAACLPINTRVSSGLMHADREVANPADVVWNGGVSFANPLIGLIHDAFHLADTDALLGLPNTNYPIVVEVERGISFDGGPGGDSLTIGADRLSISAVDLRLDAGDPERDVARMIFAEPNFASLSVLGTFNNFGDGLPADQMVFQPQIDIEGTLPAGAVPEDRPMRVVDRYVAVIALTAGTHQFFLSADGLDLRADAADIQLGTPVALNSSGSGVDLSLVLTDPGDYQFSLAGANLIVNGPLNASVLDNDLDLESDPLVVTQITTAPQNGSVTLNPDGTFVYAHDGSETTSDSFSYEVTDGTHTVAGTTVVRVLSLDDAPIAVSDTITVDEGGSATVLDDGMSSVLDNDFDAENDTVFVELELIGAPASASSFALNLDGTFEYIHDGSNSSSDEFIYLVQSGSLPAQLSCYARVGINVNLVNDPPTTSGISDISIFEVVPPVVIDLNAAFDDEEDPDSALLYQLVGNTLPGLFSEITIDNGLMRFTISGASGVSTLTVRATDTGGAFVETSFNFDVFSGQP